MSEEFQKTLERYRVAQLYQDINKPPSNIQIGEFSGEKYSPPETPTEKPTEKTVPVTQKKPEAQEAARRSNLDKVIDVLQTGEYAAIGAFREIERATKKPEPSDINLLATIGKGFVKGVKEKEDFFDYYEDRIVKRKMKAYEIPGAFVASILVDPFTYTGILPLFKTGAKALKGAPVIGKGVKYVGKPVGKLAEVFHAGTKASVIGEKAVDVGESAWRKGVMVLGETWGDIGKKFKPGFGLPKEVHFAQRRMIKKYASQYQDILEEYSGKFASFTDKEMENFVDVLDKGVKPISDKVASLAAEEKKALDWAIDELVERGVAKETAKKINYFPHFFEKYMKPGEYLSTPLPSPKQAGFLKARGEKLVKSLQEKLDKGLITKAEFEKMAEVARREGVDGWVRNAGEVLARYKAQVAKTIELDNFIKEVAPRGIKEGWIKPLQEGVEELPGFKKITKLNKEYQFAEPFADQFTKFYGAEPLGPIVKAFNKVNNLWKAQATAGIVMPNFGFHARNALSNTWQNMLAGVYNPADYWKALKSQVTKNDLYKIVDEEGILRKGIAKGDIEKIISSPKSTFSKTISLMMDMPRTFGNWIEDNAKLAHMSAKLNESKFWTKAGKARETALTDAVKSTEKFLFDYTDITSFERKVKAFIPFYVWARKNIPLQVEMMLKKPVYYSSIGRAKKGAEKLSEEEKAVQEEQWLAPWLKSDMFTVRIPYLKGEKARPVTVTQINKFLKGEGDYTLYWTPDLAFKDVDSMLALDTYLNMVGPFFKTPIELAFGKSLFTNAPIYDQNTPEDIRDENIKNHVLKAIRPYQTAYRLLKDYERDMVLEFINQLFGIKLYMGDLEQGKIIEEIGEQEAEREIKSKKRKEEKKQYYKKIREELKEE